MLCVVFNSKLRVIWAIIIYYFSTLIGAILVFGGNIDYLGARFMTHTTNFNRPTPSVNVPTPIKMLKGVYCKS